eukprot:GDKI01025924.1.p1 GENE.GDKI01025924.1~~GDKI01025924.1.p1  ORF type:complete len:244 (-),score=60.31 GDKI01025924.1:280-1011(-)
MGKMLQASVRWRSLQSGLCPALRRFFTVKVDETPNPQARLFSVEGKSILDCSVPRQYSVNDAHKIAESPLASSLFKVPGVSTVLLSRHNLTVLRDTHTGWDVLQPNIVLRINRWVKERQEGRVGPEPAESQASQTQPSQNKDDDNDSDSEEIIEEIKSLVELRVRPFVQADGGDVEFMRFDQDTGTVWIYMKGACQGCSGSSVTLHLGIGQMLKHYVPEVREVRQCDENGEPIEDEEAEASKE